MGTTTYRDGPATIRVTADFAAILRQALQNASGGCLDALEAEAEKVQQDASAQWYGPNGVNKRKGTTGDIAVSTEVQPTKVKVSVGSTDLKNAIYVHRPGPLSLIAVEITKDEYRRVKKTDKKATVFHARKSMPEAKVEAGKYYRSEPNPNASDGRYLLPLLVSSPYRKASKGLKPLIEAAIAKRVGRTK